MSDWLYTDIVKDHFTNPRNVLFEDESAFSADARGQTGNIKCGDQMLVLLKIKDDIITDVRWKTYGCASAIASTSMLSELIKGMNIKDAYTVRPEDLVTALGVCQITKSIARFWGTRPCGPLSTTIWKKLAGWEC